MLPAVIQEFLKEPRFGSLAYTDQVGHPVLWRAHGWVLSPEGADLALVGNRTMAPWLPPEGQPFKAAAVLMAANQFVSFQVKGIARIRATTEEELREGRAMLTALGRVVEQTMGTPASLYEAVPIEPAVTVLLQVEQAFSGSPGPSAGAQVGGAA